jgi:hypothetical protein
VAAGEVLRLYLREDLVEEFRVDPSGLDAVRRMAGKLGSHPRPH